MTTTVTPPVQWSGRAVAAAVREHREIAHAAALIGEDYHDRFLIEDDTF